MGLQLTQHASRRANQRGVPHGVIAHLLNHADVETRVGGGCVALSLSRRNLAVVCDPDDGAVSPGVTTALESPDSDQAFKRVRSPHEG